MSEQTNEPNRNNHWLDHNHFFSHKKLKFDYFAHDESLSKDFLKTQTYLLLIFSKNEQSKLFIRPAMEDG
jgi:hypothetical protein